MKKMRYLVILTIGILYNSNAVSQVTLEPDKLIVGGGNPFSGQQRHTDTSFFFLQERGLFRIGAKNRRDYGNNLDPYPYDLGLFSGAWGYENFASGAYSTAFGKQNEATADYAVSWGLQNKSLGAGNTTWGTQNSSEGLYNSTAGLGNITKGFATTTFGMYADPIVDVDVENFTKSTNPLLIIGNGSTANNRSNAMVVLRNGNIGIGTNEPMRNLDIQDEFPGIRIGKVTIEEAYETQALWIHGDIYPASTESDLGANSIFDHWDKIVAMDFISYQDNANAKSKSIDTKGLKALLNVKAIAFKGSNNKNGIEKIQNSFDIESLAKAIPEAVLTHDDYYNPETKQIERRKMENPAISYMKLIPILTKSIQELKEIIDEQNERILELEKAK